MSRVTLGFVYSAMAFLLIGITIGFLFFLVPEIRRLNVVHAHLNLVGFVIFLIFGVAYHILPRFKGRPLYSVRLAWWQLWLANIGLVGLLTFIVVGVYQSIDGLRYIQAAFAVLLALSMYLFIYNILRTLIPSEE